MKIQEILNYLNQTDIDFEFRGSKDSIVLEPLNHRSKKMEECFFYGFGNTDFKKVGLLITESVKDIQNQIVTKYPKYVFYHILSNLFSRDSIPFIKKENLFTGKNTFLYNINECGKEVRIYDNSVIGRPGFAFYEVNGEKKRVKPFAGVSLGNNVEIGSLVNIDSGVLNDTVIGDNVKIDSEVYIAHDSKIGKNTIITSNVSINGFVEIGEDCYIGSNATIRNRVKLGDNVIVGMGANVTKSFGSNVTLVGNPARPLR